MSEPALAQRPSRARVPSGSGRAPSAGRVPGGQRLVVPLSVRHEVRAALHGRRIQRVPLVGSPDDVHEREAARIAERIAASPGARPSPPPAGPRPVSPGPPPVSAPPPPATAPSMPRSAPDHDRPGVRPVPREEIQRAPAAVTPVSARADPGELDADLAARIAAPAGGRPLPLHLRDAVAPALPYDFSAVRVHDGPQAQRDAAAVRARAFTFGNNIWLGAGEAVTDLRLMGHELVHVAQQGAAAWRPAMAGGGPLVTPVTARVQRDLLPDWVIQRAANTAAQIPGFNLLCVLLGHNPITDQDVARTPLNIASAVLDLVPRGDAILRDLQSSGALQRAFEVIQQAWGRLGLTLASIRQLVSDVWAQFSGWHPIDSIDRVSAMLRQQAARVVRFALDVGGALLEVVFDAVMSALGPRAQRVSALLRRSREVFGAILRDPLAFVGHLMDAVGQGFRQFGQNILTHLGQGLIAWLTGALSSAGIQMPAQWDLRGILSIVLQVLGLSYGAIRTKLVRAIGERPVAIIERAMPFLVTLVREGPLAAWQQIVDYIGSLRDTVINGVRDWVRNTVVSQAIQWVISLMSPVGAVIRAIQAIYRVISVAIDQFDRLTQLVETIVDSLGQIVAGQIGAAANSVESALARFVPVVIDLMARLLGLGDLPERIKTVIGGIHARVDQALDRLVAWIVERGRALIESGREVVRSAVAWWQERRTFQVEGESHSLYFEGTGPSARLMVASFPEDIDAFMAENRPPATATALVALYADLQHALATVRQQLVLAAEARATNQAQPPGLEPALDGLRDSLRAYLRATGQAAGRRPANAVSYGPPQDGLATWMDANPLASGDGGTAPSAESEIWRKVRERYAGGRTFYVRGHLLNQQLGGPGNRADNLAPISQTDNATHERQVEHEIKRRVLERTPRAIVHYRVDLAYESSRLPGLPGLLTQLEHSDIAAADRDRVRDCLVAEQKLPTRLTASAVELQALHDRGLTEIGPPFVNANLPLTIASDLTGFDGARRRQRVVLMTADVATIASIPGLGSTEGERTTVAQRIVAARTALLTRHGRLTRYADFRDSEVLGTAVLTDAQVSALQHDGFVVLGDAGPAVSVPAAPAQTH